MMENTTIKSTKNVSTTFHALMFTISPFTTPVKHLTRYRRLYLVIIYIFLLTVIISAQKNIGIPEDERVICVFDFIDFSSVDEDSTYYPRVFSDSISLALAHQGYVLVPQEIARESLASIYEIRTDNDFDATEIAKKTGADVYVVGFYRIEGETLYAGVRAYDIISSRIAVSLFQQGTSGHAVFDTIDAMAEAIAERVRQELQPLSPSELVVRSEMIRIEKKTVENIIELGEIIDVKIYSSDEGAKIFCGETLMGEIKDGAILLKAKVDAPLSITLVKAGYQTRTQSFMVSNRTASFRLAPCYRLSGYELGVSWAPWLGGGAKVVARDFIFSGVLGVELSAGIGSQVPSMPWRNDTFATGGIFNASAFHFNGSTLVRAGLEDRFFIAPLAFGVTWYPLQKSENILRFGIKSEVEADVINAGTYTWCETACKLGPSIDIDFPRWTIFASYTWRILPLTVIGITLPETGTGIFRSLFGETASPIYFLHNSYCVELGVAWKL